MGLLDLLLPDRCAVVWLPRAQVSAATVAGALVADPATALLALRKSGRLARRSLPRVRRPAPRVRRRLGRPSPTKDRGRALWGRGRRAVGVGLRVWPQISSRNWFRPPTAHAVTFVPAVGERELWRGFNPAAALAHELSLRWQLPVLDLLARRHSARRQRGLPLAERRRERRGCLQARRSSPLAVVLVDDVYTSGATVGAAARALRGAGAREVDVVTFARTLRGHR